MLLHKITPASTSNQPIFCIFHQLTHMRSIFTQHSIPKVVFSDNRPQYKLYEFEKFSELRDIMHKTSSIEVSQITGFVEILKPSRKPYKSN